MKIMMATLVACLSLAHFPAHGSPADYVAEPTVEAGEVEIDMQSGVSWRRPTDNRLQAAVGLGFGYGIGEHWFSEVVPKWQRTQPGGTQPSAVEWENKFVFTEPGQYDFDVGVLAEIERAKDHAEGWEVRIGPLLQTGWNRWQVIANPLFTRKYRAAESSPMQFGFQFQAKYRWRREAEFGMQGFGELGQWNHWAESNGQSQRFGPALFGKMLVGEHQTLRYNTAWLVGTTAGAPRRSFRLQLELEM